MYVVWIIIGCVLFFVAYKLKDSVRKKEFERRNTAGKEVFENYSDMKSKRHGEGLSDVAGGLLYMAGVACFIFAWIIYMGFY